MSAESRIFAVENKNKNYTTMLFKKEIIDAVRSLATQNVSYGRLYNELVRNDDLLQELQDKGFNDVNEMITHFAA